MTGTAIIGARSPVTPDHDARQSALLGGAIRPVLWSPNVNLAVAPEIGLRQCAGEHAFENNDSL